MMKVECVIASRSSIAAKQSLYAQSGIASSQKALLAMTFRKWNIHDVII
jgi:hypothetical protein